MNPVHLNEKEKAIADNLLHVDRSAARRVIAMAEFKDLAGYISGMGTLLLYTDDDFRLDADTFTGILEAITNRMHEIMEHAKVP